eukprot:scaffold7_cov378-Prasinococcus_capsulatus_cf.AAC.16
MSQRARRLLLAAQTQSRLQHTNVEPPTGGDLAKHLAQAQPPTPGYTSGKAATRVAGSHQPNLGNGTAVGLSSPPPDRAHTTVAHLGKRKAGTVPSTRVSKVQGVTTVEAGKRASPPKVHQSPHKTLCFVSGTQASRVVTDSDDFVKLCLFKRATKRCQLLYSPGSGDGFDEEDISTESASGHEDYANDDAEGYELDRKAELNEDINKEECGNGEDSERPQGYGDFNKASRSLQHPYYASVGEEGGPTVCVKRGSVGTSAQGQENEVPHSGEPSTPSHPSPDVNARTASPSFPELRDSPSPLSCLFHFDSLPALPLSPSQPDHLEPKPSQEKRRSPRRTAMALDDTNTNRLATTCSPLTYASKARPHNGEQPHPSSAQAEPKVLSHHRVWPMYNSTSKERGDDADQCRQLATDIYMSLTEESPPQMFPSSPAHSQGKWRRRGLTCMGSHESGLVRVC